MLAKCVGGLLAAWVFFYVAGRSLLTIPDAFHDGTYWQGGLIDEE